MIRLIILATTIFLFSLNSYASEERYLASSTQSKPSLDNKIHKGVLGNWAGFKDTVTAQAIEVHAAYKGDLVSNASGGVESKSTYLENLDLTFDFNLDKKFGWNGLSFFLYGLGNKGGTPSEFIGDSLVTSNIEAPATFKIYEMYFKKQIQDNYALIFGARDLNADFNAADSAGIFINSAFGISPTLSQTGENGPSIFPTTSIAFTFSYSKENTYGHFGLFNAMAGKAGKAYGTHFTTSSEYGYLAIGEYGYLDSDERQPTKIGVGAWTYTKDVDQLDGAGKAKNSGFYMIADRNFTESLGTFLKFGFASDSVNQFTHSFELGMTLKSPFSSRPNDALGLGYASATASDDYVTLNNTNQSESVIELNYQFNFDNGFSVTPDLQYVMGPGLSKTLDNAFVQTIRLEFEI